MPLLQPLVAPLHLSPDSHNRIGNLKSFDEVATKSMPIRLFEREFRFGNFGRAAVDIAELTDVSTDDAEYVYKKIMSYFVPECVLSFMKNTHLNVILDFYKLRKILNAVKKSPRSKPIEQRMINDILVTVAENPSWCSQLGYDYLLAFVKHKGTFIFALHLVQTPSFLERLNSRQIKTLITDVPELEKKLPNKFQCMLEQDNDQVLTKEMGALSLSTPAPVVRFSESSAAAAADLEERSEQILPYHELGSKLRPAP